jgi:hypothetical protein
LAVSLMVSNQDNVEKAARLTEAISAYLYGAAGTNTRKVKKRSAKSGRHNRNFNREWVMSLHRKKN